MLKNNLSRREKLSLMHEIDDFSLQARDSWESWQVKTCNSIDTLEEHIHPLIVKNTVPFDKRKFRKL